MKLIVQRVARASVEVDGCVESRIGTGLVLFVAMKRGDTLAKARELAGKVAKLAIWPEITNLDNKYQTNVQDNGFEVLVILQQSAYCTFHGNSPCEDIVLPAEQAKPIFQAFAEQLGKEYQEQMVVAATISPESRVDLTVECPGVFELSTDTAAPAAPARHSRASAQEADVTGDILPEVELVTHALQRLPQLQRVKAVHEASRVFRVFGMKKFRSALADAAESEADGFVLAVQAAGKFFNSRQQDLLKSWLEGLDLPPSVADEADNDEGDDRNVPKALAVKKEAADWTGRAAPVTPGTVGGRWAGKAGVGYKGKGKGVRSYGHGIISLDGAAALHGMQSGSHGQGQLQAFASKGVSFQEDDKGGKRAAPQAAHRIKFQKGTPTLAPMTPAPKGSAEMREDEY